MLGAGIAFLIISIVLILFAAGCFVGLFGLDPKESTLAGIILLPIGGVFAAAGIFIVAKARRKKYLLAEGVDGKAKLIQWWVFSRSGGAVSYVERCEFELEVTVTGNPPYKVNHRQPAPIGVLGLLSKGMILPVKVHPEKPKRLLLDWDQMEAQAIDEGEKKALKDRLSELEDAYKEGLIAKDEYENKRAEILKNL
jgi:hypothetical protein